METKLINGLSQIQGKYDAFFIDLWGVIHNGIQLYPDAINVLENLSKLNKRFVLMSNAPRPSKNVENFLLKLNMNKNFFKSIFTSGEAALKSLKKNRYGKNFYHLGPKRDNSLFQGFEKNKKNIKHAEFILCTGFLDDHEDSLDYYKNFLGGYTKLKMVCTNPDLVVYRGRKKEYCAGTLAEIFKNLGGEVIYFGKPYPEIYNFCTKKNETVLVIGDNIRTDIRGANNMNFDSLLITNGIHKNEFLNLKYQNYDKILNKYEATTNYYQEELIW
jgi:HAD superfamily hydrolase (TIGR01459 family)